NLEESKVGMWITMAGSNSQANAAQITSSVEDSSGDIQAKQEEIARESGAYVLYWGLARKSAACVHLSVKQPYKYLAEWLAGSLSLPFCLVLFGCSARPAGMLHLFDHVFIIGDSGAPSKNDKVSTWS
ncbi:hypothetical protein KUCAC02_023751, partial [Chaenocephalus aceratus]